MATPTASPTLNSDAIEQLIDAIRKSPGCAINLRINPPKQAGQPNSYHSYQFKAHDLWHHPDDLGPNRKQLNLLQQPVE